MLESVVLDLGVVRMKQLRLADDVSNLRGE
jgi:hypothetical protein